jgi:hypothetical protein
MGSRTREGHDVFLSVHLRDAQPRHRPKLRRHHLHVVQPVPVGADFALLKHEAVGTLSGHRWQLFGDGVITVLGQARTVATLSVDPQLDEVPLAALNLRQLQLPATVGRYHPALQHNAPADDRLLTRIGSIHRRRVCRARIFCGEHQRLAQDVGSLAHHHHDRSVEALRAAQFSHRLLCPLQRGEGPVGTLPIRCRQLARPAIVAVRGNVEVGFRLCARHSQHRPQKTDRHHHFPHSLCSLSRVVCTLIPSFGRDSCHEPARQCYLPAPSSTTCLNRFASRSTRAVARG